jgi:protein involved in polysaccharide export with SLBB domain
VNGVRSSLATLAVVGLAAWPIQAQQPTQAAAALQQAVQANPGIADLIRQRIGSSGMTPDQVRARLQASGYPATLLDAYMGAPSPNGPAATPGAQEVSAIQALGLPAISVPVSLPVDTGLVKAAAQTAPTTQPSGIFGVDVFKRTTTQFLPNLAGPVPPDYKLGAGDQLVLVLTGDVENAYTLTVTREGFIIIPQVGQLYVANLTLDGLRSLLFARLGRVYSGIRRGPGGTAHFDISVTNLAAVQVYAVGEVVQPGAYQVSSLGTVLTALYAAGGLTDRANTRRIEVRRSGTVAATFDLYDYLLRGDTRNDIRLQTGDVVYVGLHGVRAEVRGAVMRSAIYELTGRESLADLIVAAGGFTPRAALQRISVERILPPAQRTPEGPQKVVMDLPLTHGDSGRVVVPPFPMQDGDVVTTDTVADALRGFVQLRGNVYQPGRFAFEPGMRLSQLVHLAAGFRPATYAGRAHIERLDRADQTRFLLEIQLPRDSAAAWPSDPVLEDQDVVTIYGRIEFRSDITVAITGMVTNPGSFPWREGMTLRDLVLMARGPKTGAYLQEAEIARMPADRSQGQLATTVRVAMDSTYLFDRDSLGRYIGPPGLTFPASGEPEVPIQPYDNVLILRQPGFEFQRTVTIDGQVQYPGTYSLRTQTDRLADILERAGGLTPRAYAEGVRFERAVNGVGRININLPNALRHRDSRDNVILQPGDAILIPEYQPSVRIVGAVNTPGSVLYRSGQGLGYYINAAGGGTRLAIEGRASVRQPNGEVQTRHHFLLFFRSDPEPQPGAEILVPAHDPNDKIDWIALTGGLAQILGSMVAIIVVVSKL